MQRNVRKVHTSGRKGALQSMVQAAYNGTLLDHPLGICLEEYLSSLNYTASAKKKGVYIVTRDFSSPSSDFLLWNRKRQSTTVLLIGDKLVCQCPTSLLHCLPCRHLYCVVKGFKGMKGTDINPRNLAEYNLGQLASLGDVPSLERGSIKVILNQILLFL